MKDSELTEHPEGGRYKEIYRSNDTVIEGDRKRSALTHIYFSLNSDEVSKFHKVQSDEVWNLYEGDGIFLYLWDEEQEKLETIELSKKKRDYCYVVKAGLWQATAPISGKVLVGCSVAPGFEFEDFELIKKDGIAGQGFIQRYPELHKLL